MPNGDQSKRKQVKLDAGEVTQLSRESLEELTQPTSTDDEEEA
jgi:hypothetical protein